MRLLTTRNERLLLRPLVINSFGFAEGTLQRLGCDRPDVRSDTDRVLDEQRDLFGVRGQAAAVPVLGPRFGEHRHLVHAALARQLDDEMAAAPVGRQQHLLDLVGNTLTPRRMIMSSERPVTFSMRRIPGRAVPGNSRVRSRVR